MPLSNKLAQAVLALAAAFAMSCDSQAPKRAHSELESEMEDGGEPLRTAELSRKQILDRIFAAEGSCDAKEEPPPAQLRRLTRAEYSRSARDILGIDLDLEKDLPLDESVLGFKNNSTRNVVTVDHAIAYTRAAEAIAREVVERRWTSLMSCRIEEGSSCAGAFLQRYGRLLWRRPLAGAETEALLAIHAIGAEQSAATGMQNLLRAMLTAPAFLYRSELGREGRLDAYEWASALSYFFWASAPDALLLDRAADTSLLNDDVLGREIERLLASPRAKEGIRAFADSWTGYAQVLQVNKDQQRFPSFDADLRQRLSRETEDFFDRVIRERNGHFAELIAADYTYGDASLARFYEAPFDAASGRIDLAAQPRRGLLGQGSVLATLAYAGETHPIKRGKFVRESLLCEELTPPPPTLNIQPPPPREGASTRERFAAHSSQPVCQGCHVKIDGAGFGLEDFDAIGRLRSIDNGRPVDASGQLVGVDGMTRPFVGGSELSAIIAHSPRAERCFALQWFRMAQGRVETEGDICAIRALGAQLSERLTIRELMVKVITQNLQRQRSH